MTRRNTHQILIFGLTIAMMIAVVWLAMERQFIAVALVVVVYLVAGLVLRPILRRNVPLHLRQRPEAPPEFRQIHLGPVTPAIRALLEKGTVINQTEVRKRHHLLYRWQKSFPEGEWRCLAEEAAGEILAWSVDFKSAASPVLDESEAYGQGQLICTAL